MTDGTKKDGSIRVGVSGWDHEQWRGSFYPSDLSCEDWLGYYAQHFQTVEVVSSFRHSPREQTLVQWREAVPKDFIFSVKANHYITHLKELKDPQQTVPPFLKRLKVLGKNLGPILFEMPPHWNLNLHRLHSFLKSLSHDHRYVFEFRNPSCFTSQVYNVLEDYGAAFCIYDMPGQVSPRVVTTDLIYVRLHGPDSTCPGQFETKALSDWADTFSTWMERGKEIYCYFVNDQQGQALQDAETFQRMIKDR